MILMMSKFNFFLVVNALLMLLGSAAAQANDSGNAPMVRLLVFGDSLVAGYGLPQGEDFPTRLDAALKARGHLVETLNGGVSGDTSAGGASRIDWALADNPDAVLVVLGGNDALRGLPPEAMAGNLDTILMTIQSRGMKVMLAGMKAPTNLGASYGADFDAAFANVMRKAEARGEVLFYPFFLEGVALEPRLNQDDGIHPNEAGVAVIVENILPHVEKLITSVAKD